MNNKKFLESFAFAFLLICGMALIVVISIVPLLELIPVNQRSYVIWILLITTSSAIFLFLIFIVTFGFSGKKEWESLKEALKILQSKDVQNSILELQQLPSVSKLLRMEIIGKLKIIEDYEKYLETKAVKSMQVFGASLSKPSAIPT